MLHYPLLRFLQTPGATFVVSSYHILTAYCIALPRPEVPGIETNIGQINCIMIGYEMGWFRCSYTENSTIEDYSAVFPLNCSQTFPSQNAHLKSKSRGYVSCLNFMARY